jgi:hypothetical protein
MAKLLLLLFLSACTAHEVALAQSQDSAAYLQNCARMHGVGSAMVMEGNYQGALDTLRHYIETCANTPRSFNAFSSLDGANQNVSQDPVRFWTHREWLKSVLYLNTTDSNYYCYDVLSIMRTGQRWDAATGEHQKAGMAIIQYVLENNRCPMFENAFRRMYNEARDISFNRWRDSVDPGTPDASWDTTLPTLEELDLGLLRGQSKVEYSAEESPITLLNVTATSNPFTNKTIVRFELDGTALIRFSLSDAAGRVVYDNGIGNVLGLGVHEIVLDGSTLPTGMLYARVATSRGEVKTIKLQHR